MKCPILLCVGLAGLLAGFAHEVQAQTAVTITFDDIATGSQPGDKYAAKGVHFGTGSFGVVAGIANGDPGNWLLNGPAGPYFLGFNDPYTMTISFDFSATMVSLAVARSNGSSAGNSFTLTGFSGGTQVATQTTLLGDINTWSTVSISAPGISSVQVFGSGSSFHPFGIDNLVVSIAAVPEPAPWVLLAAGWVGVIWRRRRR